MGRPKSSPNPITTTIKMDETVRDVLKELARDSDETVSALIRRVLTDYATEQQGFVAPPKTLESRLERIAALVKELQALQLEEVS